MKQKKLRIEMVLVASLLAAILAQQNAMAQTPPPEGTVNSPDSVLHGRTTKVADAILSQLPSITEYNQVTNLVQLSSVSNMMLTVNSLQAGDFNSLTNVRSLGLSFRLENDETDSSFTNVMQVVNDELPDLQSLRLIPIIDDLPDNKSLPLGIFDKLVNLQTLDLSGNSLYLDELPTKIFDKLVNLRTLDLSDSLRTGSLPSGIFDKLVKLETLDLSDNNELTSLPVGIFDRIPDNDFASQYGHLIHYPSVSFGNTYHSVTENQGTLLISVSLSESISRPVTVGYSTQDYTATAGQDYVATSGTLTFPAGTTNLVQTISVTILDDSLNEGRTREVFRLRLQSLENAVLSGSNLASVYIRDDDSPPPPPSSLIVKFRSDSRFEGRGSNTRLFVREGDATTVDIQVQLSHAYQLPVTVDYATQDGSAEAGQDYVDTSGTLTFPAGTTDLVQTFSVLILDDNQHEQLEYFRLDLSNPVNAHLDEDNDALEIYIQANLEPLPPLIVNFSQTAFLSIPEGNEGATNAALNVQLLNGVPDKDVTVDYATADGTAIAGQDYTETSGTLTFPAFTTNLTQSISVPILGDTDVEPNEYFNLLLSNPTNAVIQPSTARIEIVNDDQETLPPPVNVNNGGGGVRPIIVPHLSQNGGSTSSSLMLQPTSLSLSESGRATYQARATALPARDMIVNIATSHSGITVNPNRLLFTPNNWQTYQTVTVTASATAADIGGQASIRHSIPSGEGFIANNNAGTVYVNLAHTVVEEAEPPSERQIVQREDVPPTDYDQDDDGLIEISNLAQLNAIRWDLDGDGRPDKEEYADAYSLAFPSAIENMGIPHSIPAKGYELTTHLSFDTNEDGA